jgi:transposase InsO family protein
MNTKEKHQAITHLKNKKHSILMLCKLFETSPSGYFSSLKAPVSPRKIRRERLKTKITTIFTQHKSRYGRPRIYRQLLDEGEQLSEKLVGRIMRSESLVGRRKRAFRPRTTHNIFRPKYAPNLLKNQPISTAPKQVVVTDITYVATKEGWLYLAAVMDLGSKIIKGYAIEESMHTELIIKALEKAMKGDPELAGSIHHSDRGCQYTSQEYLQKLTDYHLVKSMSARGNCYDNAAMESFWATLKTEAFPESGVFESKEAARQEIFEYIEGYYHSQRIHSSLNYLTPLAAEMAAKSAA